MFSRNCVVAKSKASKRRQEGESGSSSLNFTGFIMTNETRTIEAVGLDIEDKQWG